MGGQQVTSKTKLFVWWLERKVRWQQLREAFEPYGEVVFARVNLDKETGRSRGFGFVEFANETDAQRAFEEMNWKPIMWRDVKIDYAMEDPNKAYRQPEATGTTDNETDVDETVF